jgi:nitroreductase
MESKSLTDDMFELLGTARAMRWLKSDPVPADMIEQLVWAGTRASNPNNTQLWDFIVVQDATARQKIAGAFQSVLQQSSGSGGWAPPDDPVQRRTAEGAFNLITTIGDVPAIIFICGTDAYPADAPDPTYMYSAVFAAGQNLIVAARALGLGAAFTTLHKFAEPQVRELLAIPDDKTIGLTIPIGWPARPFGPVTRRPVEEVIHRDHW